MARGFHDNLDATDEDDAKAFLKLIKILIDPTPKQSRSREGPDGGEIPSGPGGRTHPLKEGSSVSIFTPAHTTVKPTAANWPAWTDSERWDIGPEPDGPRPTSGPDFTPTLDDEAEFVSLVGPTTTDYWPQSWPDLLEVGTVPDRDFLAESAHEAELIDALYFDT